MRATTASPGLVHAITGVVLLALGVGTEAGLRSSFVLSEATGSDVTRLAVPTAGTVILLGALCLVTGVAQIALRIPRRPWLSIAVASTATVAVIVWATRGAEFSLVGMLQTTVSRSTPLALGAMAGVLCEKSGVVNIAIEAMMLVAAFGGAVAASATGNLWLGLLVGVAAGALVAQAHSTLSIGLKVDQIISGTVLNIMVLGMTSFVAGGLLQTYPNLNRSGTFAQVEIPLLSQLPVIGPVLFAHNVFVYSMYLIVPALTWALLRTRWGLRVRAVGEHPRAAAAVGIDVLSVRRRSVVLGGAVAGLAGSYLSLGSLGSFQADMTAGRGFIALAAMIIGRWNPAGAFGAALLFGFAEALQTKLAIINTPIPSQFLLMLPYGVTLLVVVAFVGRARPPAADGIPFFSSQDPR